MFSDIKFSGKILISHKYSILIITAIQGAATTKQVGDNISSQLLHNHCIINRLIGEKTYISNGREFPEGTT